MENKDLLGLLHTLEDDFKQFSEINMQNLEIYSRKDLKLEQGIINFMISTLPGDLKILNIDFKQESWADFQNSLKKITIKLKLVGVNELIGLSEMLEETSKSPFKKEAVQKTFIVFKNKIEELIVSLKKLNNPT